MRLLSVGLIACLGLLAGCAGKQTDYRAYLDHLPKSILVLPPLNESLEVDASGMFLSTISEVLGERGYYVIPVALVDAVLRENGVPLPPEMHSVRPVKLREIFGADAILYVNIRTWTTTYLLLDATTRVDLEYRLVDAASEQLLWSWRQVFEYSPSRRKGTLLGKITTATVHAIRSGGGRMERDVALAANQHALGFHAHGILTGHRHPEHIAHIEQVRMRQQKLEQSQTR
ncbi:MAG: DUF799 family lipoprotein [Phycisphaerales bacterium]|nr:DUF799 family lipoprotein [Phycisphaerales bacterium]